MKTIKGITEGVVKFYETKSDFENRESLRGFGISLAGFCRQYYPVGSEEYNELYNNIFNKLRVIYENARRDTHKFQVDLEYKSKNNDRTFGYSSTEEERTKEEVIKRVKNKKFKNLTTGRVIKPIFVKFDITEL